MKKKVIDGAYATMLERIRSIDARALILLRYVRVPVASELTWRVDRLTAIHPVFLTDAVVEARKPLSVTARRAGWQGCNLRIDRIPQEGLITLVKSGAAASPDQVRALYSASKRLYQVSPKRRGWTTMVLAIVRNIGRPIFTLSEAYAHRRMLEEAFPNNRHIEAKIRQQLQTLRDLGYLHFRSPGVYEVIS